MMTFKGVVTAFAAFAFASVSAKEAPRLSRAEALKEDKGAVLISIRSEEIYAEKLRVWFAPADVNVSQEDRLVVFERVQGFGGTPMLRSLPRVYALPSGKYRLIAHMVGCGETLLSPGTSCTTVFQMDPSHPIRLPTHRYEGDVPTFLVEAGKLTNAGEFVLEFEPGPSAGTLNVDPSVGRIRWKPISTGVPAQFSQLPRAALPEIPEAYRSRISCENPPGGLIKRTVLPFTC